MLGTKITIPYWYERVHKDLFTELITKDDILDAELINKNDIYNDEESSISYIDCEITINVHQLTILLHQIKMFGRYAERADRKRFDK